MHQLPKIIPVTHLRPPLTENGKQLKMKKKKKKNQGEYLFTTAICLMFVSGICFQELNLFFLTSGSYHSFYWECSLKYNSYLGDYLK